MTGRPGYRSELGELSSACLSNARVVSGIGRGAQGTRELGRDEVGGQWPGWVVGEDGGVK